MSGPRPKDKFIKSGHLSHVYSLAFAPDEKGLASGSYLAINDSVNTSEALEEALRVYEASGAVPYRTRSVEQFAGYFDGLELVEPGVVLVADWRPDPGADRGPEIPQMGGVGRKP